MYFSPARHNSRFVRRSCCAAEAKSSACSLTRCIGKKVRCVSLRIIHRFRNLGDTECDPDSEMFRKSNLFVEPFILEGKSYIKYFILSGYAKKLQ